jgi:branched-chain amino acid transport system substrate-binding protein
MMMTEASTEAPAMTEMATMEATEAMTEAPMMTEAATEAMTEMATMSVSSITEEATTEMTEVAMAPTMMATEAMTEAATEAPAMTEMATMEPTEAMTEMATEAATEMATAEATSMMATAEATMEMTPMVTMEATGPAAVAAGSTVTVAADGQVVIGLAAGLSGEGIAPLGIDIQRGAELALKDRPSVTVGGKTFMVKLDVQDDQCSADGGQAVGNRFASDGSIVGVVGPMCSSACRAAAPIFDAAGFTTISPSCTAPDLTTSNLTSFNRDATSDAFQGKIAAQYIYNVLGIKKIATIHDGSAYGEGLVNVVTTTFTALGGVVVASEAVTVGDTDFRGLLEDVAAKSPELIYFGGFPAEAARLIQQRADTGLDNVPFMGADGINGTEVVNLAGSSAEGIYASKGIPSSSSAVDAFLAKYKEAYGEEPPAPYHTNAYDGVNILLDAIEATATVDASGNLVIDRAKISEYVRSLKNFQGLTGTLNADGTGETAVSDIGIYQVKDGAFTEVEVGIVDPATGEVTLQAATEATPEATMSAMSTEMATMEATAEATP